MVVCPVPTLPVDELELEDELDELLEELELLDELEEELDDDDPAPPLLGFPPPQAAIVAAITNAEQNALRWVNRPRRSESLFVCGD